MQVQYSWTIPSGAWTHRRAHFKGEPEELVRLLHSDKLRQEKLEKADATIFWGEDRGPVVMVWDGILSGE